MEVSVDWEAAKFRNIPQSDTSGNPNQNGRRVYLMKWNFTQNKVLVKFSASYFAWNRLFSKNAATAMYADIPFKCV